MAANLTAWPAFANLPLDQQLSALPWTAIDEGAASVVSPQIAPSSAPAEP